MLGGALSASGERCGVSGGAAAALAYAAAGLRVFPLHTPQPDGTCDCNRVCGSSGKHPRTRNGVHDATSDPDRIRHWWGLWPHANVGVATGGGLVVLDVDEATGGFHAITALEAEHGELSPTWAVETGGNGLHLWFAVPPGHTVRNSASALGPGLDVRGEGGYVVAPPSLHASGKRYQWAAAWRPGAVPLAPAPPWLLAPVRRQAAGGGPTAGRAGAPVCEGERNTALTRLAGAMRRYGFSEAAIHAALLVTNQERCQPPLPEAEVAHIAHSVARYAPADATRILFNHVTPFMHDVNEKNSPVVILPSGARFRGVRHVR